MIQTVLMHVTPVFFRDNFMDHVIAASAGAGGFVTKALHVPTETTLAVKVVKVEQKVSG